MSVHSSIHVVRCLLAACLLPAPGQPSGAADPADPTPALGKPVETAGILDVVVQDDFETGSSRTHHWLLQEDGTRRRLQFEAAADLPFGTRIRLRGLPSGAAIAVAHYDIVKPPQSDVRRFDNVGEQRLVVLLVNSFENPVEPAAVQEIRYRVFEAANPYSINSYYEEVSYEKAFFTGQVSGWYTLALPQAQLCTYEAVLDAAVAAADNDVYFPDYERLMVLFPEAGCGWGGVGNSGPVPFDTADGTAMMSWSVINSVQQLGGTAEYGGAGYHELGHNFGLRHANDWECGEAVTGADCQSIKYGDVFDNMGQAGAKGHFSAMHKELAGWFDPSQIMETTAAGSYALGPLEINSSATKALKIPTASGLNYYVEFRRPIGFDANLLSFWDADYDGAVIHTDWFENTGDAQLLDTTPHADVDANAQFADSLNVVLGEGQVFYDAANDVTITTLAVSDSRLVVYLGRADPIPTAGTWGLVGMFIALAVAATLAFRRRTPAQVWVGAT